MKIALKIFAAAAVLLFFVACTKDDSSSTKAMSQQEVLSKLDSVGVAILKQIVPEDLRYAVYILTDVKAVIEKREILRTPENREQWIHQMIAFQLDSNSVGGANYLFDGKKFGGYAELSLEASDTSMTYKYDEHETNPFNFEVTSRETYTGDLKVTCSQDTIKLGVYGGTLHTDSLYTLVPTHMTSSIKFGGKEYAKMDFKTDFSALAGWDLSDIITLLSSLDKVSFSAYGEIDINGTNTYKMEVKDFSVKNFGINFLSTLCGKDGNDLATFWWTLKKDVSATGIFPIFKSNLYVSVLNGSVEAVRYIDGNVYFYFPGYEAPQMTINYATQMVSFADGTADTFENVFILGNFSDTVMSAFFLAIEFKNIIEGN